MEIYRQRQNTLSFEAPSEGVGVTATVSLNGGEKVSVDVAADGTTRTIEVPYVTNEGQLVVEWSWTAPELTVDGLVDDYTTKRTDTYDIVSPILDDSEIKEIHPNATPAEIVRIEKATRHIINAHTGQRFGKYVGEYKVAGGNTSALLLPRRLVSLNKVNDTEAGTWYEVANDGWILYHYPWGVPPVKADYYGLHMHTGGVIHNPNNVRLGTFAKREYVIDGTWGWEEIPAQVREAAKLLVNDYACADAAYRDRYLTSMTAADWRIQFNNGAFVRTGNVRADQLLADFVLQRGWVVV